jgi:hypothetical protein
MMIIDSFLIGKRRAFVCFGCVGWMMVYRLLAIGELGFSSLALRVRGSTFGIRRFIWL